MELLFLGRGSAFNTLEGNTSAFFKEGNTLFIIDSGETTFELLIKNNILDNIEKVYLMITHTHSDHIGSLGTLTSYLYYKKNQIINIIIPEQASEEKYLNNIKSILEVTGCTDNYILIKEKELDDQFKSFSSIRFKKTNHTSSLVCYGILFSTEKGFIYYSGDTNELNNVKELIDKKEIIDKLYLDTTLIDKEDNNHLSINVINSEIPSNLKNKVYCMHVDNDETINKVLELGFKIVEKI